jgi:hypothetical protein
LVARRQSRDPRDDEQAPRLLRLKRIVQLVTMAGIVIFVILSFVLPPDIGSVLFPLVVVLLAAYTLVSGYVAFETGISGIGAVDSKEGWSRWLGIVWLFAGCFLAIFGLSYFFV